MEQVELLTCIPAAEGNRAVVRIRPEVRSSHPVSRLLFGKFCEHLGSNIYQGMEAQILYNPTFGRIRLPEEAVRHIAQRQGWPGYECVWSAYQDGAALGWFRLGEAPGVLLSPDAYVGGTQAQRVETPGASAARPAGVSQWTYLPLHRTRGHEFRVVARAAQPVTVELALSPVDAAGLPGAVLAKARLSLTTEWQPFTGRLDMPPAANVQPDGLFLLSVTADRPANFVLGRVLLYGDDHVGHADPEVLAMLRQARLSVLRWPGGNFVSGYRWRDGVGPADRRPTMPNPVWHGVLESNLFGTDEFLAYCRAAGCEPLICVNAGDGTPDEAAAWVQYCNGPTDTPMGRLRAENGHPEPYRVRYWEIGNEIFGRHQIGWTTPAGHVDRFLRFAAAMKAADPTIRLLACGGLHLGVDAEWNRRLIAETGGLADCQTHHILEGGEVGEDIDVKELYHAFLAYPVRVGQDYRLMRQRMREGGIARPHLAITEMQLFASYRGRSVDGRPLPGRIPTPSTISEALYAALFLHECIRLGDLVEMFTHTGTVNHGGGLRKGRQRVWANPVHYAHVLESDSGGRIPVAVEMTCGTYSTGRAFGHLPVMKDVPNLDALAALSPDGGELDLLLVHRSASCGAVELGIDLGGFPAAPAAEALTLCGAGLDDENTMDEPHRVVPAASRVSVASGEARMALPPYSLTRIRFRRL